MSAQARKVVPIKVIAAEVERVGYEGFDAKSFLLGFSVGRAQPSILQNEDMLRWHVEALMSPHERGAHLPRPGDA